MSVKKTFDSKRLATDAVLSAMVVVLGCLAINTNAVKISFETLPILFAALALGPLDGFIVGTVGTLIYQMLLYGFSLTTALWILPYLVCGLLAGLMGKSILGSVRENIDANAKMLFICISSELAVTALNTVAIYTDSKIYGYYFPGLITGVLLLRLGIAVAEGTAFAFVLPPLLKRVKL